MSGFLTGLFSGFEGRAKINPKHPGDPTLISMFADPNGNNVNSKTAMRVTAIWACISLISETMATLPEHVYKKADKKKSKAKDHPLYAIIAEMPFMGMTSFEYREMMVAAVALHGDYFARILTLSSGQITGLEPIQKAHIVPKRNAKGEIYYRWNKDGKGPIRILFDHEVFRIPYKLLDGLNSVSPIETHKRTIGNAMRSGQYLEKFYKNSAVPTGAIVSPNPIGPEAALEIRESWEKRHKGAENYGKVAILDGGMDWKQFGMSNSDAQYIEMNQFSVTDIARIYLMPPHKIGDLSRATFTNIEQQNISFVVDVILSWVRRIESRQNQYLLSKADRMAGYYVAFDLKGLLRGDSAARANFYRTLFYVSAMNPNEIRASEDMSPIENGDKYYVQGATIPTDQLFNEPLDIVDPELVKKIDEIIADKLKNLERSDQ